jgi:rod shape determining protein RodA
MRLKLFRKADPFLLLSMLLLSTFGLMVILSSNPEAFRRQLLFVLSGFLLYFLAAVFDYRWLKKIAVPIFVGVIIFLLAVVFGGTVSRGARRWLELGGLGFQPSEFTKPALVILLAVVLESRVVRRMSLRVFVVSLLITFVPAVLVFLQPDLGTAVILLAVWGGAILASGVRMRYLLGLAFAVVLSAVPIWSLLKEYQRQRILYFFNPAADPLGGGYNVLQSMIAVGSGRFWGRGFGRGTQSHLKFLPEHYTDFVFATLAEEWGFVGVVLLFFLFGLLLVRILKVALNAKDDLGSLLAVGVFTVILTQFFVNVGMNMGIMPVTGVPLPLISYGGSSVWMTMISLGLVQSVAMRSG